MRAGAGSRRGASHGSRGKTAEEGFSLVELLVVVIILGILTGIAIAVFLDQRRKAHDAAAQADARSMVAAQFAYQAENEVFADTVSALEDSGFSKSLTDEEMDHGVCTFGDGGGTHFVVGAMHDNGRAWVVASTDPSVTEGDDPDDLVGSIVAAAASGGASSGCNGSNVDTS